MRTACMEPGGGRRRQSSGDNHLATRVSGSIKQLDNRLTVPPSVILRVKILAQVSFSVASPTSRDHLLLVLLNNSLGKMQDDGKCGKDQLNEHYHPGPSPSLELLTALGTRPTLGNPGASGAAPKAASCPAAGAHSSSRAWGPAEMPKAFWLFL